MKNLPRLPRTLGHALNHHLAMGRIQERTHTSIYSTPGGRKYFEIRRREEDKYLAENPDASDFDFELAADNAMVEAMMAAREADYQAHNRYAATGRSWRWWS
jgi:hypothetical protein